MTYYISSLLTWRVVDKSSRQGLKAVAWTGGLAREGYCRARGYRACEYRSVGLGPRSLGA